MQEKPQDKTSVHIIGYDSGWGCRDYRCEDGPQALEMDQVLYNLQHQGIAAQWKGLLGLKHLGAHNQHTTKEQTLAFVHEGLQRLHEKTYMATQQQAVPVVVGGDHVSAVGTWSGIVNARNAQEQLGLIWIDAHMDSHTYETSFQGKFGGWWHGQPVSALLGYGLPALTHIGGNKAKLAAQHISLIGIHSFEPAEEAFLKQHHVRVYSFAEVKKRGFNTVFAEALQRAQNGTRGFGLSIDLDAFHPAFAPGVGAEEKDGLLPQEILPVIKSIGRTVGFAGLEIAELNPHKDKNGITAKLAEKIIEETFKV